ncbi:MAG: hypothetical protein ABIX28_07705 [Vicinamibacterales bacterium]
MTTETLPEVDAATLQHLTAKSCAPCGTAGRHLVLAFISNVAGAPITAGLCIRVWTPAPSLLAHAGHEHKVMGTVTMAAADHVILKDKDGKEVMVEVTKGTKVKAKPAIKVEEIKVGTRVVITAVEDKTRASRRRSSRLVWRRPPPNRRGMRRELTAFRV